ncbi:unnamed protein product [Penicillium glandicola]
MDKLPPEILTLIFAEIWDLYPESLRRLNTVNRAFYHTAARFLHEILTISFNSKQEYELAVADILTLPTNEIWYKHTRRLDIVCGRRKLQLGSNRDMTMGQIPFPDDDIHYAPVTESLAECDGFVTPNWELLVSLLGKLHRLVELNYAVVNMFPQVLLKALHQNHPACRLNIHAFRLKNLTSLQFGPCEMDLIQSPCLHGIRFSHWPEQERTGPGNFHAETIYRIISIAPNLQHFYVDIESNYAPFKAVAKGQGRDSSTPAFNMGKLKSLSLRFNTSKDEVLKEASRHTDFSKLESLNLDYVHDDIIPRAIASRYSFCNLQSLSIVIGNLLSNEATELMFQSINPLIYLKIKSSLEPIPIEKILMRHGPTLQGLVLLHGPYYNPLWTRMHDEGGANEVLRYAKLCPRLRDFQIEIQRKAGSEDEIRLYEACGQFPFLECLTLDMECTMQPGQSGNLRRIGMSAVAGTAFNLTLDPAICLAIWHTIASTQKSGRLRKVQLYPHTRRSQPRGAAAKVLRTASSLKRSYLVRRRIFDKQELPTVVEIDATGFLPPNSPKNPSRRPLWFEALPQVDYAFGTMVESVYPLYPEWRSKWLTHPLQMLAVDLLTNRRKRNRETEDGKVEGSGRKMKLPRTISQ